MRRNMSKFLSVALAVVMLFTITMVGSFATEEYGAELDRGFCGLYPLNKTSEWILYQDGTLIIKGEGVVAFIDVWGEDGILTDLPTSEQLDFVKRIVIEEGIISIEALGNFPNLEEIVLPNSLTSIESRVLNDSPLLDVFIPASVVSIGSGSFDYVKSIVVDEDNANYSSDEYGVLYNKEKTELLVYPASSENTKFTVPSGVEIIHTVGQQCENLIELTIPSSVKTIEGGAFAGSAKLKNIYFSEGLEEIGESAFVLCVSLEKVEFPASLKKLGTNSFADCYSLNEIIVKNPKIELEKNGFGLISMAPAEGVAVEKWLEICAAAFTVKSTEEDWALFEQNTTVYSSPVANERAVVYIHDIEEKNNAEIYAEQYGINVERIHFYGEWEYDWENYLRTRKCDLCEMTETEALEKETEDDVEIIAPENPDHDFEVDEFEKGGDNFIVVEEIVNEAAGGNTEVLRVFDINLKNHDGVHVQPDGSVKVKLPLDWKKDGNYKVYRVNDDGTLTDMNASRQGSHMVFETDHFSIYVIVEEGSAEDKTDKEKPDIFAFFKNALNILINLIKKFITFLSNLK